MTDEEETASTDERQPQHGESPILSHAERSFVRMSFWQTVLSVIGVFIAVIALYAALSESEAVRQQTAASVWPRVQLHVSDHLSDHRAELTVSLTNAGVGPARMRSMRVRMSMAKRSRASTNRWKRSATHGHESHGSELSSAGECSCQARPYT